MERTKCMYIDYFKRFIRSYYSRLGLKKGHVHGLITVLTSLTCLGVDQTFQVAMVTGGCAWATLHHDCSH